MTTTLPTTLTKDGLQPVPPSVWRAMLLALVTAQAPGYTDLPAALIEDILSTDIGAVTLMDQMRVELINSISPNGMDEFILNAFGAGVYGVLPNGSTNTSIFVVFSGTPGFVISRGFIVSDGTHQYVVQDGGAVATGGATLPLFCVARDVGTWAVPANTVTTLVTSVPSTVTLTCTNPETGIPGTGAESEESYRTRVLQAGLAASQGMSRYLKTLLSKVPGVQSRLVSAVQQAGGGWAIICGGGDPNLVAYAIWQALFDISTLVGSTNDVLSITRASPAVIKTALEHGLTTGQNATISGSNVTSYNGTFVATVIDPYTFSIPLDTSAYSPYTGGGVLSPNARNIVASLNDYPDTYSVSYINPAQQNVAVTVTWNTTATNFVSPIAVAEAGQQAIVDYINSISVAQPIILYELQTVFQEAVADILPPYLLTRMVFSVSIDGTGVSPSPGTGIIAGDSQGFFLTDLSQVVISQG